jgi:hypothetical protein
MTDLTLDHLSRLSIAERIAAVRTRMVESCVRAGRSIDSVTLVAVSKTHPPTPILEAVAAGVRDFGENRIEEVGKIATVTAAVGAIPLTWHMIGHVQSRKARDILTHYHWLHSLDSVKLAERFARFKMEGGETAQQQPFNVLLEINISGEVSKDGFVANRWREDADQRAALWASVRQIVALRESGLIVRGLMTVAPVVDTAEQVRPVFTGLHALRDALAADFPDTDWQTLSMGMTDDYAIAIEEGATLIRVGRAIFGERTGQASLTA